jgi:uncharacterized membrane protein
MNLKIRLILTLFVFSALLGCSYRKEKTPALSLDSLSPSQALIQSTGFAAVRDGVFKSKCIDCHDAVGKMDLSDYHIAFAALDKIYQTTVVQRTMPKSPVAALSQDEILLVAAWVKAGGPEFPLNGSKGEQPVEDKPPVEDPDPIEDDPKEIILEPKFDSIKEAIFKPKCLSCHSSSGSASLVPLDSISDLTDPVTGIVIPGNSDDSQLFKSIQPNARRRMPPRRSRDRSDQNEVPPLSKEEIKIIEDWIKNGATD